MKKLSVLATLLVVSLIAVSCGKVEKILPKNDGEWQITYQKVVTTDESGAVIDSEESSNVDSLSAVHFEPDGTGHSHNPDGSEENFTWSVNGDNDVLTITVADSSGTSATPWDILESSGKEMVLTNTSTVTVFGTWTIKSDMTMERIQ